MNITDPTKFDSVSVVLPGMAPCVAYFDARHLSKTRTETLSWNFGDGVDLRPNYRNGQKVDANTALTSQVVAHWYLNPGTYKGSCTVHHENGTSSNYPFTVQVLPDTRTQIYFAPNGSDNNDGSAAHPFQSVQKFQQYAQSNNVHIKVAGGMTFNLTTCIQLGSNIAIDGGGSTIMLGAGLGFAGQVGRTSDVFIHHFVFSSVNQHNGNQVMRLRGQRMAVIDCAFDTVGRGIEIEDNNSDCVLLQGIVQLKPTGIDSQCFYIGGGHRVCELWNVLTGSNNESPDRADGTVLDGWTIEYCDYSQPGQAKAAVTRRIGNDGTIANSIVRRGDISFNVGIGSPGTIQSVRITNNCVRDSSILLGNFQSTCRVRPGVQGITWVNNVIEKDYGPVFSVDVDPAAPTTDVVIKNNIITGTGANLRLLSQPLPGIVICIGNTINGKPVAA